MDAVKRRTLLRSVGWALSIVVLFRVGGSLLNGVRELRGQPLPRQSNWAFVAASGVVFLAAHATLVLTWRSVLSCWDARLPFWTAARIWSVSNLGRYLPGKVWQIGAMGAMAREVDVSPVAASGSAILGTLVNILAGFVIALISGRGLLERAANGSGDVALLVVVAACVALAIAPWLIPALAAMVARIFGRTIEATLPVRAVLYALLGNLVSWLMYGFAFMLFSCGLLGVSVHAYQAHLASYTISYLLGYIVLFAPAGIGVREGALLQLLQLSGLAAHPEATLVTIASRVWLTLLEVTPALLFWTHYRMNRRSQSFNVSDATT